MMELKNKKDFEWHKKALDLNHRHECCHQGTPEKYPCRVESDFWDDPNGPYAYEHTFIYRQSVKCEKCGHTQLEWPDVAGAHYEDKSALPLERRVRLFRSLPLGTRFKYLDGTDVWVILERLECGLIAKWEGVDGWVAGQAICSFADTPEECEKTEVLLCEA